MSKIHISDERSLDLDTNDRGFTFSWGPLFSNLRDNQKPNQKMSEKLVFNININITAAQSAENRHIRFGSKFDKLQVNFGAPQPEEVTPPVESDRSTPVQVNVEGGSAAAKPSMFTCLTCPQSVAMAKGKSLVVVESPVSGNFEVGSSSTIPEITKSQRCNMIDHMRRMVERAETLIKNSLIVATTEASKNATTEVPEQYVNFPQLASSRFHSLSAAAGEENVLRISHSPPTPFRNDPALPSFSERKRKFKTLLNGLIQECAIGYGQSKTGFLKSVKDVISTEVHPQSSGRRGESPPTKKRVQFQGAGSTIPAAVVDRRGEPKKFLHHDQYQNSDHQDSQLTPIKSLGYGALARRGYNPISPPSPRQSGNRPLSINDNPPVRHPSSIYQHRHQGSESSSGFDKRKLKFPSQSSSLSNRERAWRHKMTPTPTALMSLKKKAMEERSRKGKFVIELSPSREYTPMNPHDVGGKSIEKMVDHLKESIRQINEKEVAEDEDIDQEMSGSNSMFYTCSSLQREKEKGKKEAGPTDAEDDEDDTLDSTHRLLEQLSQKDEQLLRMEKKLEEMRTMISVMQANNPSTPQV